MNLIFALAVFYMSTLIIASGQKTCRIYNYNFILCVNTVGFIIAEYFLYLELVK